MIATMTRPVLIPFRWVGTRLDIRAHLTGSEPLFAADDVCAALDLFVDYEIGDYGVHIKLYPADTVILSGIQERDGQATRFFTAQTVRDLAYDRPLYAPDNGFIEWFEAQFFTHPLEQLANTSPRPTPDLPRKDAHSIRDAARTLSRDPAISIGQKYLFAALAAEPFHWIARENDIWVPREEALKAGYLVRQRVRIPAHLTLYPQLLLTDLGLATAHRLLGGIAELEEPDPTPHLELL